MSLRTQAHTLSLPDATATAVFGRILGRMARDRDVILLHGGLGVGKTTLTQAIAVGLEVPDEQYVSSPSFALMHEYSGRLALFHLDCYRLSGEEDVEDAGLADYIGRSALTVIEWPERIGSLRPAERLDITLESISEDARTCRVEPHGTSWVGRLEELVQSSGFLSFD